LQRKIIARKDHHKARQSHDNQDKTITKQKQSQVKRLSQDKDKHKARQTQDKARQDKAIQDKTRQDKTRQDKTRQGKTRQDKTRQGQRGFKDHMPEDVPEKTWKIFRT
jgi:hypothetical protein